MAINIEEDFDNGRLNLMKPAYRMRNGGTAYFAGRDNDNNFKFALISGKTTMNYGDYFDSISCAHYDSDGKYNPSEDEEHYRDLVKRLVSKNEVLEVGDVVQTSGFVKSQPSCYANLYPGMEFVITEIVDDIVRMKASWDDFFALAKKEQLKIVRKYNQLL